MAGVHHTGKRFRSVLCLEWEPRLSNGTPVRDIPTKLVGRVVEGAQRGRERLLLFDPLARRLVATACTSFAWHQPTSLIRGRSFRSCAARRAGNIPPIRTACLVFSGRRSLESSLCQRSCGIERVVAMSCRVFHHCPLLTSVIQAPTVPGGGGVHVQIALQRGGR